MSDLSWEETAAICPHNEGASVCADCLAGVLGSQHDDEDAAIMVCGHPGRSWSSGWKQCMQCNPPC